MNFFELAFRLGIIIAIFSFIWGFLRLMLYFLRGGNIQSVVEEYLLKSAKYFLLVNMVVLNDIEKDTQTLLIKQSIFTALILLMYFVGNMQKKQRQFMMMSQVPSGFLPFRSTFNIWGEIIAASIGILAFVFFVLYPSFASYGLSQWFFNGVISLENTFILGFIFKVIGFLFLLGIIQKTINAIFLFLAGRPLFNVSSNFYSRRQRKNDHKEDDNDDFDDYEEVK